MVKLPAQKIPHTIYLKPPPWHRFLCLSRSHQHDNYDQAQYIVAYIGNIHTPSPPGKFVRQDIYLYTRLN